MNFVTLPENADLQEVVDDPDAEKSTLTEWFTANTLSATGHHLTYCEFPSRYTWDGDHKVWNSRRRGFKLGRLRYVHPGTGETFINECFLWWSVVQEAMRMSEHMRELCMQHFVKHARLGV